VLTEDETITQGGNGARTWDSKKVKIVTNEDIQCGTYSIEDVVLPLVGSKVTYPTNETGAFYETILAENGLSKDRFKQNDDRDLSLRGDYRKLICKPTDVDYRIVSYADPLQPLLQTDLMKLSNIEVQNCVYLEDTTTIGDLEDDSLFGMLIGFTLPSSAYATIALRELMKRPTASEYQSELLVEGDCESKVRTSDATLVVPSKPKKTSIVIGATLS